jgi:hypothetical protein
MLRWLKQLFCDHMWSEVMSSSWAEEQENGDLLWYRVVLAKCYKCNKFKVFHT